MLHKRIMNIIINVATATVLCVIDNAVDNDQDIAGNVDMFVDDTVCLKYLAKACLGTSKKLFFVCDKTSGWR